MTKKVSGLTRLTSLTLDMTDNCIPGGNPYVGGDRDPPYVEYARIRGGGEIPRVTTFGAFPGSADLGSSKFAQKVRGDR